MENCSSKNAPGSMMQITILHWRHLTTPSHASQPFCLWKEKSNSSSTSWLLQKEANLISKCPSFSIVQPLCQSIAECCLSSIVPSAPGPGTAEAAYQPVPFYFPREHWNPYLLGDPPSKIFLRFCPGIPSLSFFPEMAFLFEGFSGLRK